ncbi:MAG: sigma-70 family RNA polymerase sigma factor [Pseudomonadota bacterium]
MSEAITQLLDRWQQGDPAAGDALLAKLYAELRALAAVKIRDERPDHTLQPTALVHEAYEKLVRLERIEWRDRAHFLAMAARVMREVLIDHARGRNAAKRDGGQRVTVSGIAHGGAAQALELLDLDSALSHLSELDPVKARVVELRYFAGLSIQETAAVLSLSPATVKRHWQVARSWLYDKLAAAPPG